MRRTSETMTTADRRTRRLDFEDGTVDRWLDGLADFFVSTGKLKSTHRTRATYYTAELFTEPFTK